MENTYKRNRSNRIFNYDKYNPKLRNALMELIDSYKITINTLLNEEKIKLQDYITDNPTKVIYSRKGRHVVYYGGPKKMGYKILTKDGRRYALALTINNKKYRRALRIIKLYVKELKISNYEKIWKQGYLNKFLLKVSDHLFDPNGQKFIEKFVEIFITELKGQTTEHVLNVDVYGILIPNDKVEFKIEDKRFVFRRASKLIDYVNENDYIGNHIRSNNPPDMLLEVYTKFKMHTSEKEEYKKLADKIIVALKIASKVNVHYDRIFFKEETIIGKNIIYDNYGKTYSRRRIIKKDQDFKKLIKFCYFLFLRMVDYSFDDYISFAYDRFCDIISTPEWSIERKLAEAVMGLECIYVDKNETGEVGYRFRNRIVRTILLMGSKGNKIEDIKSITNNFKEAYNIRSKYLHGATKSDKTNEQLLYNVMRFLGISLILAILCIRNKQDDFILNLDYVVNGKDRNSLIKEYKMDDFSRAFNLIKDII